MFTTYNLNELEAALAELEAARKVASPDKLKQIDEQIDRLEFQIEKIKDWNSDIDLDN